MPANGRRDLIRRLKVKKLSYRDIKAFDSGLQGSMSVSKHVLVLFKSLLTYLRLAVLAKSVRFTRRIHTLKNEERSHASSPFLYQIQACFKVYAQILLKEWWTVHVNHIGQERKFGVNIPLPNSAAKFEFIADCLHLISLIFPPLKSRLELMWYVITLGHLHHLVLRIFPFILFTVSV